MQGSLKNSNSTPFRQVLSFVLLYLVRPVLLLLNALVSSFYNALFAWWLDNRGRKPSKGGFPEGFKVQRIGVTRAVAVSDSLVLTLRNISVNIPRRLGLYSAYLTTSDTPPRHSFPRTETGLLESGGLRATHNISV